jgi:hypothetical protein
MAAHLVGLLLWIEHPDRADLQRAVHLHFQGARQPERPEPPVARGLRTLAEMSAASGVEARTKALERWARTTWDACAPLHAHARRLLAEVLGSPSR